MIESIEFNLDKDGFISQECPACKKRFKVQFGKGADGPIQHCPYCPHNEKECWMTSEQMEYLKDAVVTSAADDLSNAFKRGLSGSKNVTFKSTPQKPAVSKPEEPDNDWPIVEFKSGERIKHDNSQDQLRCPVTGDALV